MHLPNIPKKVADEIIEKIRMPEGTVIFHYSSKELFDKTKGKGIILEIETGSLYYRLERDENLNVQFFHSSPGSGTRVATVNISEISYSPVVMIFLIWSPNELRLSIGTTTGEKKILNGEGVVSMKQFRITPDGKVIQIGDDNVEVSQIEIYAKGKPYLQPTAIEKWKNNVEAITILLKGESREEDRRFNTVVANMALVMMVTGFESYCKRRFLEMEGEGIKPDFETLIENFSSKIERENQIKELIIEESIDKKVSPTNIIINQKRIDFQNYSRCKTAFKKGYNISFSEDLGLKNTEIEKIQKVIRYRHRIVHYSIFEGLFNIDEHNAKPIFATKEFAIESLNLFDSFLESLHKQTLKIN